MSKNLDQAEKALLEQIAHYEQGAAYYAECAARAKEALQHIQSIRNFENVGLRQATEVALKSKKGVPAAVKQVVAEVPALQKPAKAGKTAKKAAKLPKNKVVEAAPVALPAPAKKDKATAKKPKAEAGAKFPKTGEDFWLSILAGGESLSSAQIRDTAVARVKEQGVSLSPADLKKLDQRMGFQLATLRKKNIIDAQASGQGRTKLYTLTKPATADQAPAA
jgi:hypothetical protein